MAETLGEEKAQDQRLTDLTRSTLLPAALQMGEEEEGEEAEEKPKSRSRKKS